MKWIILLVIGLIVVGCQLKAEPESTAPEKNVEQKEATKVKKITAEQAKKMIDETTDVIILDVRTPNEYKEKHIEDALLIPVAEIKDRAEEELPDKDAVILVYCRSGGRSAKAANQLAAMGYRNVHDFGGIDGWPYETVR